MTTNLTDHFTLDEMVFSQTAASHGVDNDPPDWAMLEQLHLTALFMEEVRTRLGGKPITVNSCYRNAETNALVGGVPNSDHKYGRAVDFVCPSFGNPAQIVEALAASKPPLAYDQIILENQTWVHIARAVDPDHPKRERLVL